jgi:hypothetical protein
LAEWRIETNSSTVSFGGAERAGISLEIVQAACGSTEFAEV